MIIKIREKFAHFYRRENIRAVVGNLLWLFFDKVLRVIISLIIGVWIARYLGPANYGIWSYALAFVAIFASLLGISLEPVLVRDLVRNNEDVSTLLGSAWLIKFIGGIATLLSAIITIVLVGASDSTMIWLVGIVACGTIIQSFNVMTLYYQAQLRLKYVVFAQNIALLLVMILKVVLVIQKASLLSFVLAGVLEILLGVFFLGAIYLIGKEPRWSFDKKVILRLLNDSWPLTIMAFTVMIQARIDQVMLGKMLGSAELGQYSVALKVVEAFGFIPMMIYSTVSPVMTASHVQNKTLFYQRLVKIYRIMFGLFVMTALPLALFGQKVVLILFGSAYLPAGGLLALFSIRLLFANFGVAKGLFIANENLFRYSLVSGICGSVVNVVLNYVLIPLYASRGAIVATLTSLFVMTFLVDLFFTKMRINLKLMLFGFLPFISIKNVLNIEKNKAF